MLDFILWIARCQPQVRNALLSVQWFGLQEHLLALCLCADDISILLVVRYEQEGRARRVVDAQQLWFAILEAQIETGNPYMLYKDACNRKSNQQNLGTIRGSNLCTEIIEYVSPEETAVCNLASLALPRFVREKDASNGVEQMKLLGSLDADNRYGPACLSVPSACWRAW